MRNAKERLRFPNVLAALQTQIELAISVREGTDARANLIGRLHETRNRDVRHIERPALPRYRRRVGVVVAADVATAGQAIGAIEDQDLVVITGQKARAAELERALPERVVDAHVGAGGEVAEREPAAAPPHVVVLEAETLIDDHLKEAGKARYIIEDDESTRPERVLSFLRNLFQLDARIYLHFGRALDPFGNPVDDAGRSVDGNGRTIDIQRYTFVDGAPAHDAQRDAEYTRLLGEWHDSGTIGSLLFLGLGDWLSRIERG